jgi:hypothetical protein
MRTRMLELKTRFGASILQRAAYFAESFARLVLYHFPDEG